MSLYVYRCPVCPASVGVQLYDRDHERPPYCLGSGHRALMERVPDTARALLPLDQEPAHLVTPGMVPAKVEHLHKAGILLPETQHALDWLWRNRATNGMAEAFLMVGGRRCVDLVAFARLMRGKRA